MSVIVQRVMQAALLVCSVIILVWIIDVFLRTVGFVTTMGLVLCGAVSLFGITRPARPWLRWIFCIALILCFVEVFLVFLGSAEKNAPVPNVPTWMQALDPYVYALLPVIVLGGLIWIVPTYWRRK